MSVIARIVTAALLMWAALDRHPYDYYVLLRWITCFVASFAACRAHSQRRHIWTWLLGALALLFNPVAPVHLHRGTWVILDMASAALFVVSVFVLQERHGIAAPVAKKVAGRPDVNPLFPLSAALRSEAMAGDAQFRVGRAFITGEGVPKDAAEAVRWYRMAAEQGNADAQYDLGLMYKDGEGVTRDPVEAARWWRMAAEQGNAEAQFLLGMAYLFGKGVPKDPAEAVRWLRKAAEQGHVQAQQALTLMRQDGPGSPE